jgi:phosphomannomutase
MSSIIFGTDGWRGLIGKEINNDSISLVAQAFAVYMRNKTDKPKVAVAFDGRLHSGSFASIFAGILAANGIETELSDRILPTPVLSFHVAKFSFDAGVMITASHNPSTYNGIKFKASHGGPFSTEETMKVEQLIGQKPLHKMSMEYRCCNFMEAYKLHLKEKIDFECIRNACLSIAIDSMAGAGASYLEAILKENGIAATTIFGVPQTDFAGRLPEPVAINLQPLSEFLKKGDYSLGVALDGDADRLGVLTEEGNWMNIQQTILYLAQYCKQSRKMQGGLVKTSSVTEKLALLVPDLQVYNVQVGFKYVSEAMIENRAAFGAEESGGFGFQGHLPERDGIFSALMFLEMLAQSGYQKLSGFIGHKVKELGEIYYARTDKKVTNPARVQMLNRILGSKPDKLGNYFISRTEKHDSSRGITNSLKFYFEGNPAGF